MQKIILRQYNVSLEAAIRRIIGITKDAYALIIYENNNMWNPVKSARFPGSISKSIFPKHLTLVVHEKNIVFPDKLDVCELSDWGLNLKKNQYKCYYSAIHFIGSSYNRIVVLLQVEEIEEDEKDVEWGEPIFR